MKEKKNTFGGRKKGSLNKKTVLVKNALQEAFLKLGGIESLVNFGKKNPIEFYKLWIKILPIEIKSTLETESEIKINLKNSKFNRTLIENNIDDLNLLNNN